MVDGDGLSIGEVGRRLSEVTARLENLASRMETNYVRFDLFEAAKQLAETERSQLDLRISKLEGRSEWLVRTVGGIIVAALLGLILAAGNLTGLK